MKNKKEILPVILVILLILYVIFAFQIRTIFRAELIVFLDLIFICLFIFFAYSFRIYLRTVVSSVPMRFGIIIFTIFLMIFILYRLSSFNRREAASNYFKKHENEFNEIVNCSGSGCDKEQLKNLSVTKDVVNIYKKKNLHVIKLYGFIGYGYGYIYSDSLTIVQPANSPGGSPIVKWYKVKDHWYYYSFFD